MALGKCVFKTFVATINYNVNNCKGIFHMCLKFYSLPVPGTDGQRRKKLNDLDLINYLKLRNFLKIKREVQKKLIFNIIYLKNHVI